MDRKLSRDPGGLTSPGTKPGPGPGVQSAGAAAAAIASRRAAAEAGSRARPLAPTAKLMTRGVRGGHSQATPRSVNGTSHLAQPQGSAQQGHAPAQPPSPGNRSGSRPSNRNPAANMHGSASSCGPNPGAPAAPNGYGGAALVRPPVQRAESSASTASSSSSRTITENNAKTAAAAALTTNRGQGQPQPSAAPQTHAHAHAGSVDSMAATAALASRSRSSSVSSAQHPQLPGTPGSGKDRGGPATRGVVAGRGGRGRGGGLGGSAAAGATARGASAAAARSSSLNPLKIEPKQGLQDKLLKALIVDKSDAKSVGSNNSDSQRAAARLSTQLVQRAMAPKPTPQSAVAAAALARPNAETAFAKIESNVERKMRKKRFQPAAQWSTAPVHHHHLHHSASPPPRVSMSGSERSASDLPEKHHRPISAMLSKLGIKKREPPPEPQKPQQPQAPEPSTMRRDHKKNKFNEHKPWKHHQDVKSLSDKERRRYERIWAANKGSHIPYIIHEAVNDLYVNPSSSSTSLGKDGSVPRLMVTDDVGSSVLSASLGGSADSADTAPVDYIDAASIRSFRSSSIISSGESEQYDPQTEDVHGYVIADLWRRSQLPDDILAKIWALVDHNHDGTLDRESFIVGTWLVDQCLYGRKLPSRISDQIWASSGRLNVKIRVKQKNKHKFRRPHVHSAHKKLNQANAAAILASRDARSPTPAQP